MGNIHGSGHKNLPVSYYCMPESAGSSSSQPVVDPVINPLNFQKRNVPEPRTVFQNNFQHGIGGNVKIDEPFRSDAFRSEEISFADPFKSTPQSSRVLKENDESGVTQQQFNKDDNSKVTIKEYVKEWKDNNQYIRQNAKVVEGSANSGTSSIKAASQESVSLNLGGPRREPIAENDGGHLNFDDIIDMIKEGRFKKIVTVVGAAFSASAGIPNYRSPESHLHHRISHRLMYRPEDLFHKEFYELSPYRFIDLFKDLLPEQYKPTVSHYFIKLLENKGMLLRHYTQNVDSLDMMAGISQDKLVEAHGSFRLQHCTLCRVRYYYSWWRQLILSNTIPRCKQCRWYVLPDVVFLGDQLPRDFYTKMEVDYRVADLLIIMGTPLTVQPFAFFYNNFKNSPRLVINRENINKEYVYMQYFGYAQRTKKADFDPVKNQRDVIWNGECDEAIELMAEKLGWTEELHSLMKEGHKRLEGITNVYDENLKTSTVKIIC